MAETRIAFVTGSSSGIGAALTGQLLGRGWQVVGLSRRPVDRASRAYEHIAADLADGPALEGVVQERVRALLHGRRWDRIALVNNAAYAAPPGPFERARCADLVRSHAVNVVAPAWLMGLFVRLVPVETPLRIVNVSSGAAQHPVPGLGAYCSSKAALRMAGMVLAAELASPQRITPAPRDVAIVSYEPGVVETPMQQAVRDTSPDDFPWVDLFLRFKADGIVVPADRPASEIVHLLEGPAAGVFTERRLGDCG